MTKATIEQLLNAIDRFRSSIESHGKTLAEIGPYSYSKLTRKVLKGIDQARKVVEKGDAQAIWDFDEKWDEVSSLIEDVDEGGNLGLCDADYYNEVSELALNLGVQLGIWQPMNEKGGYDWTPEWEQKMNLKNPVGTAFYKDVSYPYCKVCGKALPSEDAYHVCGSGNIESRLKEPPKEKSYIKP